MAPVRCCGQQVNQSWSFSVLTVSEARAYCITVDEKLNGRMLHW
jgi:hypothetical protein